MKILFPSWRYHPTLPARVVDTQAESDELGSGWTNTPWPEPSTTPEPVVVSTPLFDEPAALAPEPVTVFTPEEIPLQAAPKKRGRPFSS